MRSDARYPYCFFFLRLFFDLIGRVLAQSRSRNASRVQGIPGIEFSAAFFRPSFLPSFPCPGRDKIRKWLSRYASYQLRGLTSSHVDGDEFGTVGDRKTSESFTSPRRGKSSRGPSSGRQSPGRPVNVNKEGAHFFSRYFLVTRKIG